MKQVQLFVKRIIANPKSSGFAIAALASFVVAVRHDFTKLSDPLAITAALVALAHLFTADAE